MLNRLAVALAGFCKFFKKAKSKALDKSEEQRRFVGSVFKKKSCGASPIGEPSNTQVGLINVHKLLNNELLISEFGNKITRGFLKRVNNKVLFIEDLNGSFHIHTH